ncbi:MAG TPA: hypothetical protein VF624_18205 [Tepidisphaeraceae bacterium]
MAGPQGHSRTIEDDNQKEARMTLVGKWDGVAETVARGISFFHASDVPACLLHEGQAVLYGCGYGRGLVTELVAQVSRLLRVAGVQRLGFGVHGGCWVLIADGSAIDTDELRLMGHQAAYAAAGHEAEGWDIPDATAAIADLYGRLARGVA